MLRLHSGGTNENSTYSFYCRQCGNVMKSLTFPDRCSVCGNIVIDQGYGVSGDASGSETGSTDRAPRIPLRITNIDKIFR